LRQAYPEARIELWSQDEHRIGLKPILRRVWVRKGSRLRAVVRPRYQWMYLYSLDELEQVQAERCRFLQAHPELIRGRTSFHWWPASLSTT
jgi:hypothetical protein